MTFKPIKHIKIKTLLITRKYMHAETPRLADKTMGIAVFSEHELFKVVVMVTR
jgi:hypothetical protein